MADYLTRLVERTLGLSSMVRPDLPPVFAPETVGVAPYDAPAVRRSPDPTLAARRTGASEQGKVLPDRPGPPERPVDDVPAASGEVEGPGTIERGNDAPSSPAGESVERSEASLARDTGTSARSNPEGREEIQDRYFGPLRDGVEPRAEPEERRRRPEAAPQGSVVPNGTPEGSGALPDTQERSPSEPPVDVPEESVKASDSSARPEERQAGQARRGRAPHSDPLPPAQAPPRDSQQHGRSGGARGGRSGTDHTGADDEETDAEHGKTGEHQRETGVPASSQVRGAQMPGAKERAAPTAEATVPQREERSGAARPHAPDHPISQRAEVEGRAPTIEREENELTPRPAVPAANARGRSPAQPTTSGRVERPPDPAQSARPGPDAPLVSVAGRQRATATSGFVAAHREREAAKATSSPTIRITIGRVEVRALAPEPPQPPPPPPPAASPAPALSLADYLKQYDGGRG